jgi:hypothetical protein
LLRLTSIITAGAALALPSWSGAMDAEFPRSGVVEVPPPTIGPAEGPETLIPTQNVNATQNGAPQNETTIAADPANPLNLIGGTNDYRYGDSEAGIAYSFDGGATWTANTLDAVNTNLGKYSTQGDPAVAAYRNGVFYYAFIDFNRSDDRNRLGVAKTFDGGVTWPQLGVVIDHSGGGSQDFEDKEYIAVDSTGGPFDGNVYVAWTRYPVAGNTHIFFSRSTDGGVTFSAPIAISELGGVQGAAPAVGPRGEVYVAWQQGNTLRLDRSFDGGVTWGNDVFVSAIDPIPSPLPGASFRVNSFPTIAAYRPPFFLQTHVYVAWADDSNGGEGPDVLFKRSTNEGQTWSAPIRVSDDANQSYQWFPWMAVSPSGDIDVVFFDQRETPFSTRYHTFHARSSDGGLSFLPNRRVSDAVSDAVHDGFGGGFIGDYNGVTSPSIGVRPFWTDVRAENENAEGYTDVDDAPIAVADGGHAGSPLRLMAGPNPFERQTEIRFELAEAGPARVAVFDVSGRLLWELARAAWPAGPNAVAWGGRDGEGAALPAGVYVCRIEAGAAREKRKVALIR